MTGHETFAQSTLTSWGSREAPATKSESLKC